MRRRTRPHRDAPDRGSQLAEGPVPDPPVRAAGGRPQAQAGGTCGWANPEEAIPNAMGSPGPPAMAAGWPIMPHPLFFSGLEVERLVPVHRSRLSPLADVG